MRRLHPAVLARRIPHRGVAGPTLPRLIPNASRPSQRFYATPTSDSRPGEVQAPDSEQKEAEKGTNPDTKLSPKPEESSAEDAVDPWEDYHTLAVNAYRTEYKVGWQWMGMDESMTPRLAASFLPAGQILEQPSTSTPQSERIIVVTTGLEGGEENLSQLMREMARRLHADMIELFTPIVIGLDGPASPMRKFGGPPPLVGRNPLLMGKQFPAAASPSSGSPTLTIIGGRPRHIDGFEDMGEDDGEDSEEGGPMSMMMTKLSGAGGGESRQKWYQYFDKVVNMPIEGKDDEMRRRIIFLNNSETMAETFHEWWPSLVQVVRERRGGGKLPQRKERKLSRKPGRDTVEFTPKLIRPTTIVLGCAPSMVCINESHLSKPEPEEFDEDELNNPHAIYKAFQARAERPPPWWGSLERHDLTRPSREKYREDLNDTKGPEGIFPPFGRSKATPGNFAFTMRALFEGSQQHKHEESLFIPEYESIYGRSTNKPKEKRARTVHRLKINGALMAKAIDQLGGRLVDPLSSSTSISAHRNAAAVKFRDEILTMKEALHFAASTLFDVWQRDGDLGENLETLDVTWADVIRSRNLRLKTSESEKWIKREIKDEEDTEATHSSPAKPTPKSKGTSSTQKDPVVENIRSSGKLNEKEKEILNSCLVSSAQVAQTTFDDVHLPADTVDAIRSVISLPLLFPEAFKGGILSKYATTGALLFGPPGTGKTLLARAVANEGKARMLYVKGSNIQDKYFGESEQKIKAVFSVARKIAPCVVFIDEMETMLPHRNRYGGSSNATNSVVTEFMQEMDGLTTTTDKHVVVMGATNRPYDIDAATIRRLPRRILVDLPLLEGRKAILRIMLKDEQLADDLTIDWLASMTEGYSGSDLKNLCVSAALTALKGSVHVPWQAGKSQNHTSEAGMSETIPITTSIDGKTKDEEAEQKQVTSTATLTAGNSPISAMRNTETTSDASQGAMMSKGDESEGIQLAEGKKNDTGENGKTDDKAGKPGRKRGSDSKKATQGSADKNQEPKTESSTPSKAASTEREEHNKAEQPLRILTKANFEIALREIKPTSSEEGIAELRKWARQYGENGDLKGRRKGYGKGFGFADPDQIKPGDSGFGRVAEDT